MAQLEQAVIVQLGIPPEKKRPEMAKVEPIKTIVKTRGWRAYCP